MEGATAPAPVVAAQRETVVEAPRLGVVSSLTTTLCPLICPSMLSADFASLAVEAQRMVEAGADWLHMDVMVRDREPKLRTGGTLSPLPSSRAQDGQVRSGTAAFLDVHMMVSHPEQWVQAFADAGASSLTFHHEATGEARAPRPLPPRRTSPPRMPAPQTMRLP
jgi:hypothetical protein